MKFYSDEKFCVVDILFWLFIFCVFAVCVKGIAVYFGY
jgi:hypothetical protein